MARLSLDLDQRTGWPAELRALLDRHPRATWNTQQSASAEFWLDIHNGFRRDCSALENAAAEHRNGRKAAHELAVFAGARLRGMIAQLHGHHQVEDFHYFPTFRAAEPKLAAGFDWLARDHEQLQADITAAHTALTALIAAADGGGARDATAQRHAADRYMQVSGRLFARLRRHLDDEEDLIVPLLLERPL